MPILTFAIEDMKPLVAELEQAPSYTPSFEELYNPEIYVGGQLRNKEGQLESECTGHFWPSSEHIVPTKLAPQIIVAGDHGVYCITNAELEDSPIERGTIAYAKGCNPDVDDDYLENKDHLFGCDDGSIHLPLEWVKLTIKKGNKTFRIKISETQVELVL